MLAGKALLISKGTRWGTLGQKAPAPGLRCSHALLIHTLLADGATSEGQGRAPAEVAVPGGDVLVGEAGGDVEHDDGALAVDVVAVAQPAKLLLTRRVPAEEAQLATVGREVQRVHLHADRGCSTGTYSALFIV